MFLVYANYLGVDSVELHNVDSDSASDILDDKSPQDVLDNDLAHWSSKSFSWCWGNIPDE